MPETSPAPQPQSNLDGTRDPRKSDDTSKGYTVGSTWINRTTKECFTCFHSGVKSAVWKSSTKEKLATDKGPGLQPQSNRSATVAPGPHDDYAAGYRTGSYWVNVDTKDVYTCIEPTNGDAVWVVSCAARGGPEVDAEEGEILFTKGDKVVGDESLRFEPKTSTLVVPQNVTSAGDLQFKAQGDLALSAGDNPSTSKANGIVSAGVVSIEAGPQESGGRIHVYGGDKLGHGGALWAGVGSSNPEYSASIFFAKSTSSQQPSVLIKGGRAQSGNGDPTSAGSIQIHGGPSKSGAGGEVVIEAGSSESDKGGDLVMLAGSGTESNGTGGSLYMKAEHGSVSISAGHAEGSGQGGNVTISSGASSMADSGGKHGSFTISAPGGDLSFKAHGVDYRWPTSTEGVANGSVLQVEHFDGDNKKATLSFANNLQVDSVEASGTVSCTNLCVHSDVKCDSLVAASVLKAGSGAFSGSVHANSATVHENLSTGSLNVHQGVTVGGDVRVDGKVESQSCELTEGISCGGDVELGGSMEVGGSISTKGALSSQSAVIGGDVSCGSLTVDGPVCVQGDVKTQGVILADSVEIQGTLESGRIEVRNQVETDTLLVQNLITASSLELDSTLFCSGIIVGKDATMQGSLTTTKLVSKDLEVDGVISASSVVLEGGMSVGGEIDVAGGISCKTLESAGDITCTGLDVSNDLHTEAVTFKRSLHAMNATFKGAVVANTVSATGGIHCDYIESEGGAVCSQLTVKSGIKSKKMDVNGPISATHAEFRDTLSCNSLVVDKTLTCVGVEATGALSCPSAKVDGALLATNADVKRYISGTSGKFSGNVSCTDAKVRGVVSSGRATVGERITCNDLIVKAGIKASTVELTGAFNGATADFSGSVVCGSVSSNTSIYCEGMSGSGDLTTESIKVDGKLKAEHADFDGPVTASEVHVTGGVQCAKAFVTAKIECFDLEANEGVKCHDLSASKVSIGKTFDIHESSVLDVHSTTQGVLLPRMSTDQRLAIKSPAEGLVVYDTAQKAHYCFDGDEWAPMGTGSGKSRTQTPGKEETKATEPMIVVFSMAKPSPPQVEKSIIKWDTTKTISGDTELIQTVDGYITGLTPGAVYEVVCGLVVEKDGKNCNTITANVLDGDEGLVTEISIRKFQDEVSCTQTGSGIFKAGDTPGTQSLRVVYDVINGTDSTASAQVQSFLSITQIV